MAGALSMRQRLLVEIDRQGTVADCRTLAGVSTGIPDAHTVIHLLFDLSKGGLVKFNETLRPFRRLTRIRLTRRGAEQARALRRHAA